MAISFVPPAIAQYAGTPYGMPISLCTKLASAPAVVPLSIDWSVYGASSNTPVAITIDISANKNPVPFLDAIRSVYIDNSFSFTPIYVIFPDTGFTVICPANSIVMSPVFTNDQKIIVYANEFIDGQLPVTDIHLSNVPEKGFVIGTGQITPPVQDPSISYLQAASLTGGGVTQTYLAQNLGSAATSRLIILVTEAHWAGGAGLQATGVTLGSNAMTLVTRRSINNVAVSQSIDLAVWSLAVAAGISAVPIVTYNNAPTSNGIDMWAAYNLQKNAAAHTSGGTANGAGGISANLATGSPGIAIGANLVQDVGDVPMSGIGNLGTSAAFGAMFRSHGHQTTGGATLPLFTNTNKSNMNALVGANWL